MHSFKPGDEITISYTGYTVDAIVLEVEPHGTYGRHRGWLNVREVGGSVGQTYPEGEGPTYLAATEYCVPRGCEPVPGPFEPASFRLDKDRRTR